MQIILKGNTPSKKNSKRWTGRYLISSKKYLEWEEEKLWELKSYEGEKRMMGPLHITCIFVRGDRRKFDLDNCFSSVSDLLVKAGILEDDNMKVLSHIELIFGGYEKGEGRCIINIEKICLEL